MCVSIVKCWLFRVDLVIHHNFRKTVKIHLFTICNQFSRFGQFTCDMLSAQHYHVVLFCCSFFYYYFNRWFHLKRWEKLWLFPYFFHCSHWTLLVSHTSRCFIYLYMTRLTNLLCIRILIVDKFHYLNILFSL